MSTVLRMSTLFVRTLREDPADAEVPSHRLLVRAGYIRRDAPGIYTWLPLGLRVLRKVERIVREEMDAIGAQELLLPRAAAPRALRGDRPLDRVRRQHLPAQGPQGRRLPARPHARGDVHPRGEGPVLVVQGPAADDLPDPEQVPRRGAAARRAAARPRVRDEGLLLLRRRRRRARRVLPAAPRRLHPDLRPARLRVRHRQGRCPARWAARSREEFLARAAVGEDTYVRCTQCDYAANVEAVEVRAPAPVAYDDAPAAHAEQTPDTPTIETLVAHLNEKYPRDDRPWTAGDTLKNVAASSLKHPDGTPRAARHRPARRPRGRPEAARGPARAGRGRGHGRGRDFAKHPALVKGYIGPGALGRGQRLRHPLPRRPARRRGHPLGHRRERRRQPRARPRGRAATSPPTARSRPPTCATATPARTATAASSSPPAASRWATSSSSAASTPTRSA